MDTRDYRTEIAGQRAGLQAEEASQSWAAAQAAILRAGEWLTRRRTPWSWRTDAETRAAQAGQRADLLRQQLGELAAVASAVEAREGTLFRCGRCGTACRTHYGGGLEAAALVNVGDGNPLAPAGWHCAGCFAPIRKYADDVGYCLGTFVSVVRTDTIPGHRLVADRGWIVSSDEFDSPEDVKADLRWVAARALANAVVSFWWEQHAETVVAGYGPKGNPYYRTAVTFSGRGRAVLLEALPAGGRWRR